MKPSATSALALQPVGETATAQPFTLNTLPPGLVEVTPLSGSDLGPKITPVFYFNQPMDRASVESALQSQPAFPVRYEWIDDSTFAYS